MMRRILLSCVLFTAVYAVMYISCGINPQAGGSGTETVNTFAYLEDIPAEGAIVSVIYPESWLDSIRNSNSPTILQDTCDEKGRINLQVPEGEHSFNLQIDYSEAGLFLQSVTAARIDGDTLFLLPYISYSGTLDSVNGEISNMYLSGSTYRTSLSGDGTFKFCDIAPGAYTVVGGDGGSQVAVCGAVTLSDGEQAGAMALNSAFNRLLIENFESGFGPTTVGGIAPELWWYTFSDGGMLSWNRSFDTWLWMPLGDGNSYTDATLIPGENGDGSALQFTAVLDSTMLLPFGTAGIFFKDFSDEGIDLSAMTGISMRVRGTGTVRVRLVSAGLDSVFPEYTSSYCYPLTLPAAWQQVTIPVDSLIILEPVRFPDLYPWSSESERILRIEFEFSGRENPVEDTLRLICDDLFFNGVGVEVLER